MKTAREANTERLHLKIRGDIKAAMEEVRLKRDALSSGYVSSGMVWTDAALMLLRREGMTQAAASEPRRTKNGHIDGRTKAGRAAGMAVAKPAKSEVRRKRTAAEMRA